MAPEIEGHTIDSVLGQFIPTIIDFEYHGKIEGSNDQQCPFCDVHGQDFVKLDNHIVNHCRFCGILWKWELVRV